MSTTLIPVLDYCVGKKIEKDSGIVTGADVRNTYQLFEVVAVGEGRHENGVFIKPSVKPGDIVYTQKHAEADSPAELIATGYYLFLASRIMTIVVEG